MSAEEIAFPRGGGGGHPTHNPKKKSEGRNKRPATEAAADLGQKPDFLFGSAAKKTDTTSRKKRRKSTTTATVQNATSLLPVGGGGVVQATPQKKEAYIEALSFGKLGKGTKLLGIVKEVQEEYAVLSLPNLLTGYILKREKDPIPLTQTLSLRQVLAVSIVKTAVETIGSGKSQVTRRRIQVSALPASINSLSQPPSPAVLVRGRVTSVEDHGCLVDLGHGRQGFLAFQQIQGDYTTMEEPQQQASQDDDHKRRLNPGHLQDFVVNEHSPSKIVALSFPLPTNIAHRFIPTTHHPTLQSLCPGGLVQAKVEAVARNGLCVSFLGNVFRGAIEMAHLGGNWIPTTRQQEGSTDWKDLFQPEVGVRTVPARIIAVDPTTKFVRLSLLPHLLNLTSPREDILPPVGTVVEQAIVVRLDPGIGALLALPPVTEPLPESAKDKVWEPLSKFESYVDATRVRTAYVHISKAMDGRTPESVFAKEFAPSTTHTLRIMSTSNWMEGVASCATAKSVVQAHVLTHADLVPGELYRNVPVLAHLEGGSVMVDFGMGVRGLIPQKHLFDQAITSPDYRTKLRKEKFAVGSKVDVRCISVSVKTKKCLVTAKKALIKSKDSVTNYEDLQKGQHVTGFISNIDDRALYVTFYNRVYGRVTARSLAAELGIEDHKTDYNVGDVVKCRVINCRRRVGNLNHYDDDDDADSDNEGDTRRGYWDLNLSLKLQGDDHDEKEEADASTREESRVKIQAGAILPAKTMKVVELKPSVAKKDGGFIPGHAVVSIKSKYLVEQDGSKLLPYVECKLPFDQLMDSYTDSDIASAESLDSLAQKLFTVGKKIKQRGLILSDPKKSADEYSSGLGRLPVISLREKLIATAEALSAIETSDSDTVLLPNDETHLFMGAYVQGYVTQVNPRHGSFVRFLNGVTGLVPKLKHGLNLPKYGTVTCRIVALDVATTPKKILLKPATSPKVEKKKVAKVKEVKVKPSDELPEIKPGDLIGDVEVVDRNFVRARVKLLGEKFAHTKKIHARLHVTMAEALPLSPPSAKGKRAKKNEAPSKGKDSTTITKSHPFHSWKKGTKLTGLTCAAVDVRKGVAYVELTNRDISSEQTESTGSPPTFIETSSDLLPGMKIRGVVTAVPKSNRGVWVQVSPGISGYIPSFELSNDAVILNSMKDYFPIGARIDCRVMNKDQHKKKRISSKAPHLENDEHEEVNSKKRDMDIVLLSALPSSDESSSLPVAKPLRGDLVVGRINRKSRQLRAPALMLDLRGGFIGRCCITELDEVDDWVNMPLGRMQSITQHDVATKEKHIVVTDEDDNSTGGDADAGPKEIHEDVVMDESDDEDVTSTKEDPYAHGKYVQCRVVAGIPSQPVVEVSLRSSRIEGDLDDDELPQVKEMVQGYVIDTNKKGCFLRLSRQVEGRVILKELCDGFLHDPAASFLMGRLVVGKVKAVQEHKSNGKKKTIKDLIKTNVDLDMRESVLLESQDKLLFDDIEIQSKHKGIVTRIETYGVFVRLENSDVSGLVHKSECSDSYIKNLNDLYDPGDLVKVLVLKKEMEGKKIGFSMKASHFEDDEDSDDDSSVDDDESEDDQDEDMADALVSDDDKEDDDGLDSDDENFAAKLAKKMRESKDDDDDSDYDDDDENDAIDSDDDDEEASDDGKVPASSVMDTDVGFDWGAGGSSTAKKSKDDESSDDDSDDSEEDDMEEDEDEGVGRSSHKSRKKAAARRREEQEISRREMALADGTADENPETSADFERLLASDPNRSEHWIRYMAYHLSLADIQSARSVANRAFDRIEFRQEGEKLNVWTALLTLELKYGSPKSLQETIDRACQHNNPKKVYLRVCEMLEKDMENSASSSEAVAKADEMFGKMCKKFKSKKTVWIAHLHYLLKGGRHQEAHALLKRALTSLPDYKHIEAMSRFAQLEMEHGSMERGRTIFDGLLAKYPKRLDLLFVYVDKEVKAGELDAARGLLEKSNSKKLSDKQMKSVFKKWYRMEEEHGTDENREHVKDMARAYVEKTTKA